MTHISPLADVSTPLVTQLSQLLDILLLCGGRLLNSSSFGFTVRIALGEKERPWGPYFMVFNSCGAQMRAGYETDRGTL